MKDCANINKILNRVLLVSLTVCIICIYFPRRFEASSIEERKKITSLDLSIGENPITLNNYLSSNDILNYLKIYQKLSLLTYEELSIIKERIEKINSTEKLNKLITRILSKKEDLFSFREDIFIDNMPLQLDTPFYYNDKRSLNIKYFQPQVEYVYFNNLRLKYRQNKLLNKTDKLWFAPQSLKNGKQNHMPQKVGRELYDKFAKEAGELWAYRLKDDYVNDFVNDRRQWLKRYEEDLMLPVVYKDMVIVRNEYKIFCLDSFSGKEIWSLGGSNKSGYEYYQTFRHIHCNSYGYELLLANDMLFAELDGKLTAVNLNNPIMPKLVWEKSLGEYTLCIKPIQVKDILVTGLINTRGELWICGFDCQRGSIEWSTYIGLSCFFSPVCTISAVEGDKVFIGTNHGVLICLNSNNGKIIWLRKYAPKDYSVFEYWKSGRYNDKILNKGTIPYDTQFIEIGENHLLYYKPRESDYFYILDSRDGCQKDEILVDPERFYVIGIRSGKAIFLEKDIGMGKNMGVNVVELDSGRQIYRAIIKGGTLKGVFYPDANEILFKIDDAIHCLSIYGNNIARAEVVNCKKGWLINAEERFFFVNDGKVLFCLDAFGKKYSLNRSSSPSEYLKQKEEIKDNFAKVIQSDPKSIQTTELIRQLLYDLEVLRIPLKDIFPFIVTNIEKLRHPAWNNFFIELHKLYGDEVVTFRDVEIKFNNFLKENGVLYPADENNDGVIKKRYRRDSNNRNLEIRGETIVPLPIEIIEGPKLLNFFLLLNRDQLLCISETGEILWDRKLFYGPVMIGGKDKGRHMYTENIAAYLYNDTLVINDNINVLAINVNDGSYIWSLTNKEEMFKKEIQLPNPSEQLSFEASRLFARDIMFYTKFVDGKLILVHGDKIYSINPTTGYCQRSSQLNMGGIMELAIADEQIFLLSASLDRIEVLDKELNIIGDFALNFIDRCKETWPELLFVNSCIILHISPDMYIIDRRNGKLKNKISMNELGRYCLEMHEENLLAIVPFQRLINYHFENNSLKVKWEFKLESMDQTIMWSAFPRTAKYYFIENECVLLPFRKGGDYFVVSVDILTGTKLWERHLEGAKGLFYNLSNSINFNGTLSFIISTVYTEGFSNEAEIFERVFDIIAVDSDSRLFSLRIADGKIVNIKILPSISLMGFINMVIVETKHHFVYGVYGKFLKMVSK